MIAYVGGIYASAFTRFGATGPVPEFGQEMEGHSVVYIGIGDTLAGAISMTDKIRDDAALTTQSLHKMGIKTIILSGDKLTVAQAVAAQVGIDKENVWLKLFQTCFRNSVGINRILSAFLVQVYGGVRPSGKAELILNLQKKGEIVAMIGDGINDAAALAQSDVGIAMVGGVGAASEVASIVLMHGRLSQVVLIC